MIEQSPTITIKNRPRNQQSIGDKIMGELHFLESRALVEFAGAPKDILDE